MVRAPASPATSPLWPNTAVPFKETATKSCSAGGSTFGVSHTATRSLSMIGLKSRASAEAPSIRTSSGAATTTRLISTRCLFNGKIVNGVDFIACQIPEVHAPICISGLSARFARKHATATSKPDFKQQLSQQCRIQQVHTVEDQKQRE